MIVRSPQSHQVLQRDPDTGAAPLAIDIAGLPPDASKIVLSVTTTDGLRRVVVEELVIAAGDARDIRGHAGELLLGGPYRIGIMVYRADDTLAESRFADSVWVGDLWVLAGQSNMEGYAPLDGIDTSFVQTKSFGLDDTWSPARDPLHRRQHASDPAYWLLDAATLEIPAALGDALRARGIDTAELSTRGAKLGAGVRAAVSDAGMEWPRFLASLKPSQRDADEFERTRSVGTGPGAAFAAHLSRETGVPVGLVPCAVGGTGIALWSPALGGASAGSLYGAMMRRIERVGGRIRGIAWYQGESDTAPDQVPHYETRLRDFVDALRRDLRQADLPFLYVQIGRYLEPAGSTESWTRIRELQAALEEGIPRSRLATAIDLGMCDAIHIDADGARRLGERLARLALVEAHSDRDRKPGPRFTRARRTRDDPRSLRLVFSGVNERLLLPKERPTLRFIDVDGGEIPWDDLRLHDERLNELLVTLERSAPSILFVQYGDGLDPRTGIVDADDMALPCFCIRTHVPAAPVAPSATEE